MKVKKTVPDAMKRKQSNAGAKKKNKGKMRKGQVHISSKKQGSDLKNMKKNFEKMIKHKVESEAAGRVANTEPRPLKFIQ